MSLDWDLTRITDKENVCWIGEPDSDGKRYLNPVTDAMIWMTMAVGIGEVTERDAEEFYVRARAWERMHGASLRRPDEEGDGMTDVYLTPDDVRAHIGLRTNVFPRETDAAFSKKLLRSARESASRAWDHAARERAREVAALASATE